MFRPSLRRALTGTILILVLCSAQPATAESKTFRATAVSGSLVTFTLRDLGTVRVDRAYVRTGSRRVRVPVTVVRRALASARRRVKVRVPAGGRRRAPVLVIDITRRPGKPKPGSTPAPPATPAPGAPPAPAPALPTLPALGGPTREWGSAVLADAAAAARVVRGAFEPRAVNATANQRVPTADELAAFRAENSGLHFEAAITGAFTGTTDEILQWASWKWGIDAEVLRAVATNESWWRMSEVGDNGISFGLMQIKRTFHLGTWPLSARSTAFNVDYYGAVIREYYDGYATWLEDVEHGRPYTKGDLWGAVGAHYAGRWYTPGAEQYIAKVQGHLAAKTWLGQGF